MKGARSSAIGAGVQDPGLPCRMAQGLSKEDLDRSCWEWVGRLVDPKKDPLDEEWVGKAYRLHYPTHFYPDQNCKRNCKYNPRCFCGEHTRKESLGRGGHALVSFRSRRHGLARHRQRRGGADD